MTGRGEQLGTEGDLQHVEPPDQIKKKSFSQSTQAVEQSSDLICFQEPFCFLLSCCASNREPAEGSINPCCTTVSWNHQQQPVKCWTPWSGSHTRSHYSIITEDSKQTRATRLTPNSLWLYWKLLGWVTWPTYGPDAFLICTCAKLWAKF